MTSNPAKMISNRATYFAILLSLVTILLSQTLRADSVEQINAGTSEALAALRSHVEGTDKLLKKAAGVLVFPDVVKLGFGVGGEFGEGVLLVEGEPAAYYATSGAAFGMKLGQQIKSEVIVFRTEQALADFRSTRGWSVGLDGKVFTFDRGEGAAFKGREIEDPVVAFIFTREALLPGLTLDGAKITRLAR